ncbi:MAG TPA: hypothetical protein VE959_24145, partial [Bryobacteraceae bacterium]|nr:hypothetical protein [Bryobacteraceae bacterium]
MMSWKSGWWVLALVAAVAARGQTTYNGIATACTYQVSTPIAGSLAASGVDGSFTITTGPGCPWTAAANYSISPPSPWVTFNPASGNGTTTVNYSILSNTGASRTATLVIAGQTFPLTESGGATAPAGGGAATWQPAGTGDCAGGGGATTGSTPGTGKCTASFAGSKTITATDAANVTVSGTSAAIVVPAAATGSGPFISGTPTPNVSLNLTTTGTLDWVHWGNSLASGDMGITRKSSGGNMIGTLTHVLAPVGQNQPTYAMYQGDSRSLTWTDGKPTQTAPGDVSGFKAYDVYGPDSRWGYSLTFPAGTGANTVVLYLGGVSCGGTLTAALGDKSATFAGYTFPAQSAAWDLNYTLSFQAASATTLTVTWTMAGNNTGGNGNLFISAAALSSGGSIAPPPATHFSVTAPASANQGVPVNFTVTALDSNNQTVTGYTGTVKFSSSDNAATLPPNMSLANGVGTFPATMETLGGQTLTATDASNSSLTGMTSAAIVVNATRLVFTAAPPAATVGTAFNFTVTAEDANNNTLAGFADTVKFTSTDNAATLPANHTLSNGVGAFQATLNTAGGKTITATDAANGTVSGTSAAILVSAAGSGPFLSGTPTPNVSLDLTTTGMLDWVHWGNSLAIGDMGITRKSGGNMIGTLTQVLPPAGQIQPTFTLYNYDSRSLTWTDGNPTQTAAGDGSGFKVYDVYGPPNNYGWSLTFPAGTGANTVVLYLGGMSCGGTLTATLGDPSATFPGYTFPAQSAPWDLNYTLSFEAASATTLTVTWTMAGNMGGGGNLYISAAALSSGGSNGPGPATHFAVTPAVTTATAGTAINFTVTAQDANNNTVTGYTGTVHFTSTDGAATLPSNNSTLTGGTGSFNVIFNTPGGQTITATDTVTSTITGTSTSIAVTGTVGGTNPFVQQGGKLVGSNPIQSANEILQGASVAISADGSTAAVGAPEDNGGGLTQGIGAVYVYSRANGVWTQQGGKLIGTGASSQAGVGQAQGSGVALSADGNTLVETGLFDIGLHNGSAWVFTRSNGAWTQLGSKFQASGNMGAGAALSADGNTLMLAGTVGTQTPTAFIFSRSGSTWTQQASLVVSSAIGAFVTTDSIALSGDGNTALIGATSENNYVGAAWVFTRSGGAWTQQAKLTGSGAAGGIGPDQGKSVALSADGNTALVGGFLDNNAAGAVWVYTRSGTTWTQQGSKLIGTGAANGNGSGADQGVSVSLSADGNTAIWGGDNDNNTAGAVWVFTRSNGTWTQLGSKLVGTGGASSANQGIAVAISGDGNTLIEGGPYDGGYGSSNTGAAWVFARSAQSGGTGPATHFAVTPAATTATAGQAIGFTVTAQDANNNTVTSYTGPAGPVTFTSSDTNAAWQAGNTANLTNGAGTFLVTLNTLGTQTITATGTGITGTSAGIAVTAAPASCTYTIAGPVANSPTAAGVDGSFNVITGAGCPWTATASYIVTPSSPWIVFAPAAGSAVSYSILANTGTARSATISVGGHSFPVTQGGGATAPAGGGTGTWTPAGTGDC